jgi:hypothetical protein
MTCVKSGITSVECNIDELIYEIYKPPTNNLKIYKPSKTDITIDVLINNYSERDRYKVHQSKELTKKDEKNIVSIINDVFNYNYKQNSIKCEITPESYKALEVAYSISKNDYIILSKKNIGVKLTLKYVINNISKLVKENNSELISIINTTIDKQTQELKIQLEDAFKLNDIIINTELKLKDITEGHVTNILELMNNSTENMNNSQRIAIEKFKKLFNSVQKDNIDNLLYDNYKNSTNNYTTPKSDIELELPEKNITKEIVDDIISNDYKELKRNLKLYYAEQLIEQKDTVKRVTEDVLYHYEYRQPPPPSDCEIIKDNYDILHELFILQTEQNIELTLSLLKSHREIKLLIDEINELIVQNTKKGEIITTINDQTQAFKIMLDIVFKDKDDVLFIFEQFILVEPLA